MIFLNRDKVRRVVAGVDWGFVHPGVIEVFAVDGDGRMIRVYEVYYSGKTIDWWIERAKEVQRHFKPEAFVADPSEPAYISQFCGAGLPCVPGFNSVAPGIQAVAQRLRPAGDGRPRLVFLRDAIWAPDPAQQEKKLPTCLEEEMLGYIWDLGSNKKKGEEPVKKDDDAVDAMRYAVAYVDGLGTTRWGPDLSPTPSFEPRRLW